MSTRSTIAIKLTDNTVKKVYCHWSGYLEHNGKVLLNNYVTADAVHELLSYGDMSELAETIADCKFYMRDKGEVDCEAKTISVTRYKQQFEEFNYLFLPETANWVVEIDGYFYDLKSAVDDPTFVSKTAAMRLDFLNEDSKRYNIGSLLTDVQIIVQGNDEAMKIEHIFHEDEYFTAIGEETGESYTVKFSEVDPVNDTFYKYERLDPALYMIKE